MTYFGFGDKEDLCTQFCIDLDLLSEADILFATYYNCGGYDVAFVLFSQGNKLFEVNGFHCSCSGLEGDWEPEETTWEELAFRLTEGSTFNFEDKEATEFLADLIYSQEKLV